VKNVTKKSELVVMRTPCFSKLLAIKPGIIQPITLYSRGIERIPGRIAVHRYVHIAAVMIIKANRLLPNSIVYLDVNL
jgi:hypothetical protein